MAKDLVSAPIYKVCQPVARDEFDRLDLAGGDAVVWEDLDGHNGKYRNRDIELRPCLLDAKNDWEAVAEFLATVPKSPQTFRSYQKECLRLLLVCRFQFYKRRFHLSQILQLGVDVGNFGRGLFFHFITRRLRIDPQA